MVSELVAVVEVVKFVVVVELVVVALVAVVVVGLVVVAGFPKVDTGEVCFVGFLIHWCYLVVAIVAVE